MCANNRKKRELIERTVTHFRYLKYMYRRYNVIISEKKCSKITVKISRFCGGMNGSVSFALTKRHPRL